MANKEFDSRVILKHDIEANWVKAVNFIPREGEMIVYDPDDIYAHARYKMGDGSTKVNELPFSIVTSVNGIVPDENGEITFIQDLTLHFIDGTALVPGMLTWDNKETVAEAVDKMLSYPSFDVSIYRLVINSDQSTSVIRATGFDRIEVGSNITNARVFFGDEYCPVIFDSANNTITLDPDWVAPAACVKSVNGVLPDAEGAITCHHSKVVSITDGTAISPDILQYVGINNMSEIVGWLRNPGTYDVVFLRDVRDTAGKSTGQVRSTGFNTYKTAEGNWNAIVYFGDNLCPLVLDSVANTVTLDPDWVAPAACVKSVNGVLPDGNGELTTHQVKPISFVDGTAFGITVPQYYGSDSMAEIVDWLRSPTSHKVVFYRVITLPGNKAITEYSTGHEMIRLDDGAYNARIFFGDDLCPIILDSVNNKMIFDPDWVAPASCVKSVNDITPDENGNVELPVATDDEIIDMMLDIDMLPVVQDADGSVLVDSDGAILMN